MTPAQVLDRIRSRYTDDPECAGDDSYALWSNSEVYDAIDEAQKSLALDTKILRDARTSSIVDLTLSADDPWVDLSSKIIEIKRARLTSPTTRKLTILNYEDMDQGSVNFNDYYNVNTSSSWEDSSGTPRAIILNMDEGSARIYPTPDASGTIKLVVVRLPITTVSEATKTEDLEFDDVWKNAITFGALRELYMKMDSDESGEGVDTQRARDFGVMYNREVIKAKRFRNEKQFKTGGTVTYGGIR